METIVLSLKRQIRFEQFNLSLFLLCELLQLIIMFLSVYGFQLAFISEQMDMLSYLRIVGVAMALIVVLFNFYLMYYFGKMFKFLFSMMGKNNYLNHKVAYSMYLGYVFFYVTYLIDQYLFQYVQYAIVSITFLIES